jgi:hypothetical protein
MPGLTGYTNLKMFWITPAANNNSAATTLSFNNLGARPLYKEGTTAAPTLVTGKIYQVWFSTASNCFFLKASGSGDAVASDLLAGKKATTDAGEITGTMPNNGSPTQTVSITGSAKPTVIIPAGRSPGGTITVQLAAALASIIKTGNTVGGVAGAFNGKGSYQGQVNSVNIRPEYNTADADYETLPLPDLGFVPTVLISESVAGLAIYWNGQRWTPRWDGTKWVIVNQAADLTYYYNSCGRRVHIAFDSQSSSGSERTTVGLRSFIAFE